MSFIEVRSGREFWPLEPRIEDVAITDIAHALSNQCRFSGHTRVHYSVAEHSVRVSELLEQWGWDKGVQLWGLLHDASEAYLVDLPSPLKTHKAFGFYLAAEERLMEVVSARFGLPRKQPDAVACADGVLLATEARDLMPYRPEHWIKLQYPPLRDPIVPWGPECARAFFLERFELLTGGSPATVREEDFPTLRPTGEER